MVYIHTMEYYLVIKMNEIFAICNKMDRHGGHYTSEISQTEKDKYCMISHMWNLKVQN